MHLFLAIKQLSKLSLPIIFGQIGIMLIGAGDTYIASMYSTDAVAGIGLANGVINPVFLFGIGLTMGVSPSLAIKRGEGVCVKDSLLSVILYSSLVGLILTFIGLAVNLIVPYLGFNPRLVPMIIQYNQIVVWSFPFAIIFNGVKEYLQAFEKVLFPNILTNIAVVLNLGLNYILVFGLGPFEGMGEIGLSIASLSTRILLCSIICIYTFSFIKLENISKKLMKQILRFSTPIAFMFFIEVLAFCLVTILAGKISINEAAANNIIMMFASIAFMTPLSISSAVAVKVGHYLGKKSYAEIKLFIISALILGLVFVLASSSAFFIFPEELLAITSNDLKVIELGVVLLFVVAFFQIVDSLQVILSGILRGLEHTKESSVLVFIGYWAIGIPIGIYLAFYQGFGSKGLWIGLAISLGVVSFMLLILLVRVLRGINLKFN